MCSSSSNPSWRLILLHLPWRHPEQEAQEPGKVDPCDGDQGHLGRQRCWPSFKPMFFKYLLHIYLEWGVLEDVDLQ